jgi:Uma2 family endonuclease
MSRVLRSESGSPDRAHGGGEGDRNVGYWRQDWKPEFSNQQATWQLDRSGRGDCFDSSTAFQFPNTAIRCPDGAWVARSRLAQLSNDQKDRFLPLCPEFVIELLSPSDRRAEVKLKMTDYMANGCELGWLIDPDNRRVHSYRTSGIETLEAPAQLIGEGPVAGFVLDMIRLWDPGSLTTIAKS